MRNQSFVFASLLLVACGGQTATGNGNTDSGSVTDSGTGSGTDSGSVTDSGSSTDSGGGTDAATDAAATPCPPSVPSGACSKNGLVCEYGNDPRGDSCNKVATCTSGSWVVVDPKCASIPPTTCPATIADAKGNACTPMDAYCSYDGIHCHCTNCLPPGSPVGGCSGAAKWYCPSPPTTAGCPASPGSLGAACTPEGLSCRYLCGADGARDCTGGIWVKADGGPCPVSSRAAKHDIHYLSEDEIRTLSSQVQATKIASWTYNDPANGEGRKLGFIIEDMPSGSPAVTADKGHVDLYGYTTMMAAALKEQQKEIDALKREIAALKSKK